MRDDVNKPSTHAISKPGENPVGSSRFCLLGAAANRAAEAFKKGFYLEAITLTESLMATRLESRLAWVRDLLRREQPVEFSTLVPLCCELLGKRASGVPDAEEFKVPIQGVKEWACKRNEALHQMAKLTEGHGHAFREKYEMSRDIVLQGFEVLLAYDALDRKVRRADRKYTATDDKNNGTAFDCLRDFARLEKGLKPKSRASVSARSALPAACIGQGDEHLSVPRTPRTPRTPRQ
jgi:hypothetical protein